MFSFQEYKNFVAEGVEKDIPNPLKKGKGTGIVGEEDFIEEVKELLGKNQKDEKSVREQPALRELQQSITPENLIDRYALLVKMSREQLTAKGKQSIERSMLMELLYRLCDITQPEIGRLLGGIDYSAVSQARKRLRIKILNDPDQGKKFKQLREKLDQMSRVKI
jgi:chromosomal replication initiation ATPase DnaA